MKITITMNVDDSWADPEHETGVTEEGFIAIRDALDHLGDNIDIGPAGGPGKAG